MRVIEHAEAHYETQDVEFGRVYKWCPECIVVECECGKRSTYRGSDLTGSVIVCECGEDRAVDLGEEVAGQMLKDDEAVHPWRYWRSSETDGIPF
ncbi:MAG: hypothetical protein M3254_10365 [Actinomycetota bacterium]|nr:hypothetical protein [Actinomycetota bacterium]